MQWLDSTMSKQNSVNNIFASLQSIKSLQLLDQIFLKDTLFHGNNMFMVQSLCKTTSSYCWTWKLPYINTILTHLAYYQVV